MAWNEPGNGKDLWKKVGEKANVLDKIVQNWQRRLSVRDSLRMPPHTEIAFAQICAHELLARQGQAT